MIQDTFQREPRRHVFIIDGTLSRIGEGEETNAGILYKLLSEEGPSADQTIGYHRGVQATGFTKWIKVAAGIGVNESILEAYSTLASRYQPGDKIMLFGYSRGAYAVRSLAGFISRIGMLRQEEATQRRVLKAFRYYEAHSPSQSAKKFCEDYCHKNVEIEMLAVWDTVKALGLPYPILNRLAPMATEFHDHSLSNLTKNAFQALALDENRSSYTPLPWLIKDDYKGHVEQKWFAGGHADVGGQIHSRPQARTLSNIPLVWILDKAEALGLELPEKWREQFPQNPIAPMHGPYRGKGRFFLFRAPRVVGRCSSEYVHSSVYERLKRKKKYKPLAIFNHSRTIWEKQWLEPSQDSQPAE